MFEFAVFELAVFELAVFELAVFELAVFLVMCFILKTADVEYFQCALYDIGCNCKNSFTHFNLVTKNAPITRFMQRN